MQRRDTSGVQRGWRRYLRDSPGDDNIIQNDLGGLGIYECNGVASDLNLQLNSLQEPRRHSR
jgi:hypothetical protein